MDEALTEPGRANTGPGSAWTGAFIWLRNSTHCFRFPSWPCAHPNPSTWHLDMPWKSLSWTHVLCLKDAPTASHTNETSSSPGQHKFWAKSPLLLCQQERGSALPQQTPINVMEKRSNHHKRSKMTFRVASVYIRELGINFSLDRCILAAAAHT